MLNHFLRRPAATVLVLKRREFHYFGNKLIINAPTCITVAEPNARFLSCAFVH